jgi:molybdate transport system substrate-binding protein
VLAASSLTNVFPAIGGLFRRTDPAVAFAFSFAGTDALAAQIEQGAPADVFAGASTKYGDQLSGEGLIDAPTSFCTNRLVLIVPASNPAGIASPSDLSRPGLKLVIGAGTVPIGAYTRAVLGNLDSLYGGGYSTKVLANVVSEEDSVESVLSKVRLGEADAGFVYVTDSISAGSDVKVIDLPPEGQAVATYPIAVVKASNQAGMARRFVEFVLSAPAQDALRRAGFGPPSGA